MNGAGRPPTKQFAGEVYGGALTDAEVDVFTICGVKDDDDDAAAPTAPASPPEAEINAPLLNPDELRAKLATIAANHNLVAIDDEVVNYIDLAVEEHLVNLIKKIPTARRNYLADVRRGQIAPAPTPNRRLSVARDTEHPRIEGPHEAAKKRGSHRMSFRRCNNLGINPRVLWVKAALGR